MPGVYEHRFAVPHDAIDENGHVNNVFYVKWMQDIAVFHSREQGYGAEEYKRLGVTWVVRSHKIEYLSPAFLHDRISAFTWVSTMGRSQSLRKYKFMRTGDGKVLAKAETIWVYVNTATGRPCAIHEELARAFDIVAEDKEP